MNELRRRRGRGWMTTGAVVVVALCTAGRAAGSESVTASTAMATLVEQALRQAPNVVAARAALRERHGIAAELRARVLPHLRVEATYTRTDPTRLPQLQGNSVGADQSLDTALVIEQPLFLGGAAMATLARERALVRAATAALEQAVAETVFAVTRAALELSLRRAEADLAERLYALARATHAAAVRRAAAGALAAYDVLRLGVAADIAAVDARAARDAVATASEELVRAAGAAEGSGLGDAAPLSVTAALAAAFAVDGTLAVSQARARHPAVARAQALADAAAADFGAFRAGLLPEIGLRGEYGWETARFGRSLGDLDHGWQAALDGTWTLFDGLASLGRRRQATARSAAATAARRDTETAVTMAARGAARDLNRAAAALRSAQVTRTAAREAQRLMQARAAAGAASALEQLDARTALADAETRLLRAAHDVLLARARLDLATGAPTAAP